MPSIELRPYVLQDAPLLLDAARESWREVHPWMAWCHSEITIEETESWIRGQIPKFAARSEFDFTVRDERGAFLGSCGLNHIEPENRYCNLGYWLRTSRTRQGIMSLAVRRLSEWAFENTDLVRLEIVAATGNIASQRVAEKAGAVREGTLRKRVQLHGVWHDAALFSITRDGVPTPSER